MSRTTKLPSRLRVTIEDLSDHAAALGRAEDGGRVRVAGGVPGDVLDVKVTGKGRRELWGEIRHVVHAGPGRVPAPCSLASRCGGCPWQNLRYRDQLKAKRHALCEALAKVESLAKAPVHDPVGVGRPLGYRTKIQMPARQLRHGIAFGFYAPRSHDFVEAAECPVQHPAGEAVRNRVKTVLRQHKLRAYNPKTGEGQIRTILLRVAEGTGHVGVVLVVRSLEAYDWALMAAKLEAIDGLSGVWINENAGSGNAVLGDKTVHLAGRRRLHDKVGGQTFERSPTGFFQTNHRATEALVEIVGAMVPRRVEVLIDLYSGGGLFSVLFGRRARQVHLVEAHHGAVQSARATLSGAGIEHAQVHHGLVEEILPRLAAELTSLDVALVDPPRAGMAEDALNTLAQAGPKRIVYVSCQQKSLIRDLTRLTKLNYKLTEVHAVDMFPHTPHLEVVGLLTRAQAG